MIGISTCNDCSYWGSRSPGAVYRALRLLRVLRTSEWVLQRSVMETVSSLYRNWSMDSKSWWDRGIAGQWNGHWKSADGCKLFFARVAGPTE